MIQEISDSRINAIRSVSHFKNGQYSSLDINKTIDFFSRYYIDALEDLTNIDENTVIADIGTGYGWLAIAWPCAHLPRLLPSTWMPNVSTLRAR